MLFYNQQYSYAVAEDKLVYEDGWYSPAYTNNAKQGQKNTRIEGNKFQAKTTGSDAVPPTWREYTGDVTTNLELSLDVYLFLFRGTEAELKSWNQKLSLFNVHTNDYYIGYHQEYQNFYNKLKAFEVTILDQHTGKHYRVKSYLTGSYTMNGDGNLSTGVVSFRGVKLPKVWETDTTNYPAYDTTSYQITESGTTTTQQLVIEKITAYLSDGTQTYDFDLYSKATSTTSEEDLDIYGPVVPHTMTWGPSHHFDHHYATGIFRSSRMSRLSYWDVSNSPIQELSVWEGEEAQDTEPRPADNIQSYDCILNIENHWTENELVPLKVEKNWVIDDGGTQSQLDEQKQDVEFEKVYGTSDDGKKTIKMFETQSWTGNQLYKLTDSNKESESTTNKWVRIYYVPR